MNSHASIVMAPEPRLESQPLRLLVAERDDNAAEALLGVLRNAALTLRALHVDDLRALNAALANRAWDLLLVHRNAELGPMREIVAAVREHDTTLPIVYLDATATHTDITSALRDGAADLVPAEDRERLVLVVQREWRHARDRARLRLACAAQDEIARRIELLLATTEAGVAYVLDGMHVFANGEYLRLFGYADVDDLLGATLLDLVDTSHHDVLKSYLRTVDDPTRSPLQLRCRSRQGTTFDATLAIEHAAYDGEACWQVNLRPTSAGAAEPIDSPAAATASPQERVLRQLEAIHADIIANGGSASLAAVQWRDRAALRGQLGLAPILAIDARILDMLNEAFAAPHCVLPLADDLALVLLRDQNATDASTEVADLAESIAQKIAAESGDSVKVVLSSAVAPLGDELSHDFQAIDELLHTIERNCRSSNSGSRSSPPGIKEPQGQNTIGAGPNPQPDEAEIDPASPSEPARTDLALLRATIDRCLAGNGFDLMFQPIISVRGEPDELYEAQLFAPSRSPADEPMPISVLGLPPDTLAPGTCSRVDRWLISQAVALLTAHRASGRDARLMLNLSAESMADARFPEWLGAALHKVRLPADALVFQISEADVVRDVERANLFLRSLAAMHFRTALCEFTGAGNPRAFIARLGVDFVKLDAGLLTNIQGDPERRSVLLKTIDALQNRGKLTIVPMIDSAALLALLYQAGANYIQGDYLQGPSPEMDYNFASDD